MSHEVTTFQPDRLFAIRMDESDDLRHFRSYFLFPANEDGSSKIYFCGNSLGLQPTAAKEAVVQVLDAWHHLAVDGHFTGDRPWMDYHRRLVNMMAPIVGALEPEVTIMNTLTTNIHMALGSFYRPSGVRTKILIEADAFPSDRYAVESWIKLHGLDPDRDLIQLHADDRGYLAPDQIRQAIYQTGEQLALVWLGNVNYYTGQYLPMGSIASWAHEVGALAGFDLAHAAGNVPMNLHDEDVDFATWCTYKYLNGGPGSIAGFYVHTRNHGFPRLAGWWGQDRSTRFDMRTPFTPESGAEGWQISNQPILSMAPLSASLALFHEAGMQRLQKKSRQLTEYLDYLLRQINAPGLEILTPSQPEERGCQLSLYMPGMAAGVYRKLLDSGVILDFRKPDVLRVAPVPLYNSYQDVWQFVQLLSTSL